MHVTYQAVSRWENDESEPSFDTLKEMCKIFDCTTDDLFEMEKVESDKPIEDEVQEDSTQENIVPEEPKPVIEQKQMLALCERCNKPIYDTEDIHRVEEKRIVRNGRCNREEILKYLLCTECNAKRDEEIRIQKENERKEFLKTLKKKRIKSYILGGITGAFFLALGILFMSTGGQFLGIVNIVISALMYCFVSTMTLDNTFIPDMWMEIASWGFVTMPGIIFGFSLDGIISFILIKLTLSIISYTIAIILIIISTIISSLISVFVYPFALRRNVRGIK